MPWCASYDTTQWKWLSPDARAPPYVPCQSESRMKELMNRGTSSQRQMSSQFGGAGVSAGIEIWRIEKLHAIRYPVEQYGQFFSGDSYLVLKVQPWRRIGLIKQFSGFLHCVATVFDLR